MRKAGEKFYTMPFEEIARRLNNTNEQLREYGYRIVWEEDEEEGLIRFFLERMQEDYYDLDYLNREGMPRVEFVVVFTFATPKKYARDAIYLFGEYLKQLQRKQKIIEKSRELESRVRELEEQLKPKREYKYEEEPELPF